MYHVSLAVHYGVMKVGMGRSRVRFLKDGRVWRLPGILYADDLVLCSESEEDLRVMVGQFAELVWPSC